MLPLEPVDMVPDVPLDWLVLWDVPVLEEWPELTLVL